MIGDRNSGNRKRLAEFNGCFGKRCVRGTCGNSCQRLGRQIRRTNGRIICEIRIESRFNHPPNRIIDAWSEQIRRNIAYRQRSSRAFGNCTKNIISEQNVRFCRNGAVERGVHVKNIVVRGFFRPGRDLNIREGKRVADRNERGRKRRAVRCGNIDFRRVRSDCVVPFNL